MKKKKRSQKKKIQKKASFAHTGEGRLPPAEIYDIELHCIRCGAPLYVSSESAADVLLSLRTTGIAGLVCLCGQLQFIDSSFTLIDPKSATKD
jgi:hypothetical protein